jgi:hypothetical protein
MITDEEKELIEKLKKFGPMVGTFKYLEAIRNCEPGNIQQILDYINSSRPCRGSMTY